MNSNKGNKAMNDIASEFARKYAAENEVAVALGVKICTLRSWAARREGPEGRLRLGNRIFYNRESLMVWIRQREVTPAVAA